MDRRVPDELYKFCISFMLSEFSMQHPCGVWIPTVQMGVGALLPQRQVWKEDMHFLNDYAADDLEFQSHNLYMITQMIYYTIQNLIGCNVEHNHNVKVMQDLSQGVVDTMNICIDL